MLPRLATRQCGVVGKAQLVALGFTRNEIGHRVKTRRLIRVHQGVYAVGHEALSDRGRMIAGLLAAGPGAALSHRTAAYPWKILPSMPPFVELTTSRGQRCSRRTEQLECQLYRLPVTTDPDAPRLGRTPPARRGGARRWCSGS